MLTPVTKLLVLVYHINRTIFISNIVMFSENNLNYGHLSNEDCGGSVYLSV